MAPAGPVLGSLPMLPARKDNSRVAVGEPSVLSPPRASRIGAETWKSATADPVYEEKQVVDGMRKELVQHLKAERYREALTLTHAILQRWPGDPLVSEFRPLLEEKVSLDEDRRTHEERERMRSHANRAADGDLEGSEESEDDEEGDSSDGDEEGDDDEDDDDEDEDDSDMDEEESKDSDRPQEMDSNGDSGKGGDKENQS